jgi:hypothetical protein
MAGGGRNPLRPVDPEEPAPMALFCGHCGEHPVDEIAARSRVCLHCGLGLVLSARHDLAPGPADAFVVVDQTLAIAGVSRVAEELLNVTEPQALHRHVMDFLVPAGDTANPADDLLALLTAAASGHVDLRSVTVELAAGEGERFRARVGSCGPPPAAVVVLDR